MSLTLLLSLRKKRHLSLKALPREDRARTAARRAAAEQDEVEPYRGFARF